MTGETGARRRAASWASSVLLALATVSVTVFVSLWLAGRDPGLGYLSDPGVGRTLVFVVLPGFGWLVAALAWAVVRLTRSAAPAWALVGLGAPLVLAACWLPVGAVVGQLF